LLFYFQLSVTASDNFVPNTQTRTVIVNIVVIRDTTTQFTGDDPLRLFVSERESVNFTITNANNRITAVDSDLTVIFFFKYSL
jgi:hypothetical protein